MPSQRPVVGQVYEFRSASAHRGHHMLVVETDQTVVNDDVQGVQWVVCQWSGCDDRRRRAYGVNLLDIGGSDAQ